LAPERNAVLVVGPSGKDHYSRKGYWKILNFPVSYQDSKSEAKSILWEFLHISVTIRDFEK
jgi:hypothetical protein